MNKELILKYKEEFDHWLKGGSLLLGQESQEGWVWVEPVVISWLNVYCTYVINDEYVELRKAYAEGKTIELNGTAINGGYGEMWNKCKTKDLWKFDVRCYRIKPKTLQETKEPQNSKYQVGDIVKCKIYMGSGKPSKFAIAKVLEDDKLKYFDGTVPKAWVSKPANAHLHSDVELWEPKKDEWCWFWCYDEQIPNKVLAKFSRTNYNEPRWKLEVVLQDGTTAKFSYCEPFIGELPSHVK